MIDLNDVVRIYDKTGNDVLRWYTKKNGEDILMWENANIEYVYPDVGSYVYSDMSFTRHGENINTSKTIVGIVAIDKENDIYNGQYGIIYDVFSYDVWVADRWRTIITSSENYNNGLLKANAVNSSFNNYINTKGDDYEILDYYGAIIECQAQHPWDNPNGPQFYLPSVKELALTSNNAQFIQNKIAFFDSITNNDCWSCDEKLDNISKAMLCISPTSKNEKHYFVPFCHTEIKPKLVLRQ